MQQSVGKAQLGEKVFAPELLLNLGERAGGWLPELITNLKYEKRMLWFIGGKG